MNRTRLRHALAALVLVAAAPAGAHFAERTDSLWGFVTRSDLVVVGRVGGSRHFEEKGHTTLPGAVRLRVEEVLRGDGGDPELGILVEGMHQPRYAEGERVLVFAERRGGVLRSLQSRSEKIALGGVEDPVLDAVRRYAVVANQRDGARRRLALKHLTLELLRNPVPRLHQDAVFDLSRRGLLDEALDDDEVRSLGRLALAPGTPLVVREGVAAKLGVLLAAGRRVASSPLSHLALEPENPAVRVAALNAFAASGDAGATRALLRSLEHGNAWVRLAAVEGLGRLRAVEAVGALAKRADDPDRSVSVAALRALRRIGGSEAQAAIRKLAANASPERSKRIAQAALRESGSSPATKGHRR